MEDASAKYSDVECKIERCLSRRSNNMVGTMKQTSAATVGMLIIMERNEGEWINNQTVNFTNTPE